MDEVTKRAILDEAYANVARLRGGADVPDENIYTEPREPEFVEPIEMIDPDEQRRLAFECRRAEVLRRKKPSRDTPHLTVRQVHVLIAQAIEAEREHVEGVLEEFVAAMRGLGEATDTALMRVKEELHGLRVEAAKLQIECAELRATIATERARAAKR